MTKPRYEPRHLDMAVVRSYLIPAMHLVSRGYSPTNAFAQIARARQVSANTVYENCTRKIGLNTSEFVLILAAGSMKQHLEKTFPHEAELLTGVDFS